jgi:uncharacterized protein (TIRG00374 family)
MTRGHKRSPSSILSFVLGFALLGGVLYYVGWRKVFEQIVALHAVGILAVIASVFLAVLTWIVSWDIILRSYGIRLSWPQLIAARLSGYAISYLTPTLYFGGEPVRGLMALKHTSASATRVFATIVVERFLGGLSLIFFILIGSFYAIVAPQVNAAEQRAVIASVAFITFWVLVGLINFAGNFKWMSRLIRMLGRPLRRFRHGLEKAADSVRDTEDQIHEAFTLHWRATILAFVMEMIGNFFFYMRPQVFFYFSAHTTFSFPELSLLFTLTIMLSFFLWLTPGGLGTGEAALIGVFALVGIGQSGAVAFSLIFKFVELLFVALGLALLFREGIGHLFHLKRRRSAPEGGDLPQAASDPPSDPPEAPAP